MRVNALDHVNIIVEDLDSSARYYADLFGLERRDAPPPLTPSNAQWMYDASGRAVIHINSLDCPRTFEHQVNLVRAIGLRQVFTVDPNGVLLELNFFGD